MSCQWRFNLFSIHYFLYNLGLPAIFSYTALFANYYTNATSTQFGLLRMFTPIFGMTSKIIVCPYADRKRCHRSVLIWVLITWLVINCGMVILALVSSSLPPQETLKVGAWVTFCVLSIFSDVSYNLTTVFADSLAISNATKGKKSYGSIRLWTAIGSILGALVTSFANEAIKLSFLLPGLLLMILLLSVDIFFMIFWPHNQDFNLEEPTVSDGMAEVLKNSLIRNSSSTQIINKDESSPLLKSVKVQVIKLTIKSQWTLLKGVARQRRTIYLHCPIVMFMGGLHALQYSFFSVFINETYPSMVFFVIGMSSLSQSLVGDVPMYIFSKYMLKFMGRDKAISLAFISMGVKYLLYIYILPHYSIFYIIPIEILNGPSSALFFVTMIELGSYYSDCDEAIMALIKQGIVADNVDYIQKLRKALKVTTQSLLSTCHAALGIGLGTVLGGLIHDNYGFKTLWTSSGCFAITVGILNILARRAITT